VKDEPIELFLDEDFEVEEELESSFTPAEETISPEETKKRRHRRRGRKDREPEPAQDLRAKSIPPKAKSRVEEEDEEEEADEFSFFDEPVAPPPASRKVEVEEEEEEEEPRSEKRRRSRRGSQKSKKLPERTEEKAPPTKAFDKLADEDDEFWDEEEDVESHPVGYSRQGVSRKESQGRGAREVRPAFRSIPTWDDAIGAIVAKNMESRGKGQSQNRGKSQNQGRGGRRDNRR
jgi:hypothetical protein